jgi:tyrosyl-tRNA synthetase
LFTELPLEEIAKLTALKGSEINEAKKILATEATAMVHGREEALKAENTARTTFEEGALAEDLPSIETKKSELEAGIGILNASVQAGFVSSTSEARRQIKAGGIKVNDVTVTDEKLALTPKDLTQEGVIKLSLGKKKHVLLRAV